MFCLRLGGCSLFELGGGCSGYGWVGWVRGVGGGLRRDLGGWVGCARRFGLFGELTGVWRGVDEGSRASCFRTLLI